MLESVNTNDKLVFADLSEEEKKKRGILGRLYGPCADVIQPTRNGRKYSDKLWEKVFQQPLVEEMFNVGGIPGEIDHPSDRSETDSTRIAIMLHEKPKRGRGRPRKEVSSSGELVITNDKEFEDALVRAEKLMRKNEEPLSASQTKRIEKQIKELVDAMTKYKEGK